MNRSWWPDPRIRCWSYSCQQSIARQNGAISKSFISCKCGVAWYCSKNCQENDFRLGHRRGCVILCSGVCDVVGSELLQRYAKLPKSFDTFEDDIPMDTRIDGEDESNNDDDDGSWESIDTDDDERMENSSASIATLDIVRFIKSKENKIHLV